ncbi:hypothetical protein [Cytobacillus firmus]|uniref:hypothetical protein n=1 Tax=Cytobacillus firmus TaxID=1399 RepID=UPI0021618306|nr:hypothetical protein [Cytobacillus firmus]MCS0654790.1 hypothetical protein [Cytobacillus firmus]
MAASPQELLLCLGIWAKRGCPPFAFSVASLSLIFPSSTISFSGKCVSFSRASFISPDASDPGKPPWPVAPFTPYTVEDQLPLLLHQFLYLLL